MTIPVFGEAQCAALERVRPDFVIEQVAGNGRWMVTPVGS
jgi:hypothetical protein